MTALFTLITPLPGEDGYVFGVVATDEGARYVFDDGSDSDGLGLDSDRIKRLADWSGDVPDTPEAWTAVATQGIGHTIQHDPITLDSEDEALALANSVIARTPTGAPNPDRAPGVVQDDSAVPMTRADLLAFQADAYYTWSKKYPAVADGEEHDPEAELELRQLMTPPTDPEKPHPWLPLATTEVECGFCEQLEEADIHSAGADTITRGAN